MEKGIVQQVGEGGLTPKGKAHHQQLEMDQALKTVEGYYVVFHRSDAPLLSQYSPGDVIPYTEFVNILYPENAKLFKENPRTGPTVSLSDTGGTWFGLRTADGKMLVERFRYDVGLEGESISDRLNGILSSIHLDQIRRIDTTFDTPSYIKENHDIGIEVKLYSNQEYIDTLDFNDLFNHANLEMMANELGHTDLLNPIKNYTVTIAGVSLNQDQVDILVNRMIEEGLESPQLKQLLSSDEFDLISYIDYQEGIQTHQLERQLYTKKEIDVISNTINRSEESPQSQEEIFSSQMKTYDEVKQENKELVKRNEKTPDRSQELYSNAGDLHRNPDFLGEVSPRTASKPVADEPQPDFPVIAPLQFTTKGEWMSTLKPGYHVITDNELKRLNKFAPGLQATAQWYLNELAGSTITYLYQDRDGIGRLDVQFADENFAHLTGISPKETEMKQVVYDFASGKGDYGNIQVSHAIKDKSMVLPLLPDILSSQAFVFNDLSTVEKFHRIDLAQAIKTEDEDLLLALRDLDGVGVPASVMRIKEKLSLELEGKEKVVLGIYRERDGRIEQLSLNDDYIKDGGRQLLSLLQSRELDTLQDQISNTELRELEEKEPLSPVRILDSDADGIPDEEELKQGTNPYDFRSKPGSRPLEENSLDPEEVPLASSSLAVADFIKNKDVAGLNRHLKEGIKDYLNSDKYKDYLTKMSQLNNYSSRNLRLILAQNPEATQVASFKQWKETFTAMLKGVRRLFEFLPL